MVTFNIEKKDLWLISTIFVFMVGVGVVIAYNSGGPPSTFGHSSEEVEVDIDGMTKTLQEAIEDKSLGGSGGEIQLVVGNPTSGLFGSSYIITTNCPSGTKVVSGGHRYLDISSGCGIDQRFVVDSFPTSDRSGWVLSTACFSAEPLILCRAE